jgi:hypothetical protein
MLALRILTWLSWLLTGLKRAVELEVKAMSTILAAAKSSSPAVIGHHGVQHHPSRSTESPSDGRGLYLQVRNETSKSWLLKYSIN